MRPKRVLAFLALVGMPLAACTSDPSKSDALRVIQRDVKARGLCTINTEILASFKTQYRTKATCIPLTGGSPRASACLDALVTAGMTQDMPASYMADWPDEVATAGLDLIPAYDRKARSLIFKRCVAASDALRVGSLECARAEFTKISKISKENETRAKVRVQRDLALRPDLDALEKACGPLVRPSEFDTFTLVKGAGGWSVDKEPGAPD